LFLWINPIPGMLSISIQVMLIGSPAIETLESYEGLACPSWSLTWNLYLFPCHDASSITRCMTSWVNSPSWSRQMKQPSRRDPSWGIQYIPARRTLWSLLSCYFIELCHCWWTQSLWDGAKPQARVFSCGTVSKSWVVPWIPLFDTHHKHVQEMKPDPFGLLCRLLTYPLCLLNENSLLISELKSGIQLACTKPEWVWTVIWKPHVMPAAKVTLMPDTATFFFSKSQTHKVIQCEPHYKQWMVCLVPWDGSEHSMTEKERARLTWQSNKTCIET
jgi:hypothetical protein